MRASCIGEDTKVTLVEIDAREWSTLDGNGDVVEGDVVTLYFSDREYHTAKDVPSHRTYQPLLREPLSLLRKAFRSDGQGVAFGGIVQTEPGAILLRNSDGIYDDLVDNYTFDGAEVRVKEIRAVPVTSRSIGGGGWKLDDYDNAHEFFTGQIVGQPELERDGVRFITQGTGLVGLDDKLDTGTYLGLGSAVDLDDSAGTYIQVENGAGEVNPANAFAYVGLFRTRDLASTRGAQISLFSYSANFGASTPAYLYLSNTNDRITARLESDTGAAATATGPVLAVDTWVWIALVFDGIGGAARIYTSTIDGSSFAAGSDSGTLAGTTGVRQTTNDLLIGGKPNDTNLDGLVSEFSIFDRALTEDEVKSIFGSPMPEDLIDDADLLAYLPCNEGVLLWASDLSGESNHGSLSGSAAWNTTAEGAPDLKGKQKPWIAGESRSTPLTLVDRAMGIWQLNYEDSYVVFQIMSQGVGLVPEVKFTQPLQFTAADKRIKFSTSDPAFRDRFFVPDMVVTVASSASNNGDFTIVARGADWIQVAEALVDEGFAGNRVISNKGFGTGLTTRQWSAWTPEDGDREVKGQDAGARPGYIRLFGSHEGPITAWAIGDREPGGSVPASLGQLAVKSLALVGITATSSLPTGTGIGGRQSSVYSGTEGKTARELVETILAGAQSVGAFLSGESGSPVFDEIDFSAASSFAIAKEQIREIVRELAPVPPRKTVIGYAKAHAHLSEGDILGAATDEYRAFATDEYRWADYADPQVAVDWPTSARQADPIPTSLVRKADAEAEAEAADATFSKPVWRVSFQLDDDVFDNIAIGAAGTFTYPRFIFSSGQVLVIVGYEVFLGLREATIWGVEAE